MFGSRSGSPYGAFGLLTAPNASAGQGGPLNASNGAPGPSGGAPNMDMFSVHNKGIDSEPNTVPSVFVIPSSHPDLTSGSLNVIQDSDFLFVLRRVDTGCGKSYETRRSRQGSNEVAVVTIPKLNQLLRDFAVADDGSDEWFLDPERVAAWAVPFGAVLNSMQLNRWSGGGDPSNQSNKRASVGHNIQVSRRTVVRNNFLSANGSDRVTSHSESMQRVGVQYSVEHVASSSAHRGSRPVVQISMLLLESTKKTREPILIDNSTPEKPGIDEGAHSQFSDAPITGTPFIVAIGRVVHSSAQCTSASDCLLSCHRKSKYDRLSPIEIELGCP